MESTSIQGQTINSYTFGLLILVKILCETNDSKKQEIGLFLIQNLFNLKRNSNVEKSLEDVYSELDSFKMKNEQFDLVSVKQTFSQQIENIKYLDNLHQFFQDLTHLFYNENFQSSYPSLLVNLQGTSKMLINFKKLMFQDLSILFDSISHKTKEKKKKELITIKYTKALFDKNYEKSIENLHRYFDLCSDKNNETSSEPQNSKNLLGYSVLNLAVLHFYFGHLERSMEALREAIQIAQERNDEECLVYALSWLYRVSKTNEKKILERAISRAQQLEVKSLNSLNYLSLANDILTHNPINFPSSVFKLLQNSIQEIHFNNEFMGLIGKNHLLQSNTWQAFGYPLEEQLHVELQLMYYTSDEINNCQSYSILSYKCVEEGNFLKGFEFLLEARKFSKHPFAKQNWLYTTGGILFEFCFNRGYFDFCHILLQQLKGISFSSKSIHKIIELDILCKEIQLLVQQERFFEANTLLQECISECNANQFVFHSISFDLLLAKIYFNNSNENLALQYSLKCLKQCRSFSFQTLEVHALQLLSEIYLYFGEISQAWNILEKIFAFLGNCPLFLQGETYITHAKILIARNSETKEQNSGLLQAIQLLKKAEKIFTRISYLEKNKETFHLLALLYNSLGNEKERNEYSQKFREVERKIQTNQHLFPLNKSKDFSESLEEIIMLLKQENN